MASMDKAWYWKVVLVVAIIVGSVLYVLPTFMPGSLPGWYTKIFEKKLLLGLDLQGGIHLVLGVDLDKALEDKADQYVVDFKESMKDKRIPYKKVARRQNSSDIQIELENADDLKKVEKRVLQGFYNLKKTDGSVPGSILLSFDPNHIKELRRNTREQSRVTVTNRVDQLGVANVTIADHGESGILVQLPGELDFDRAKRLLGRTAQLEFKLLDDKNEFMRKLRDQLPQGVRMETHTFSGSNNEAVTEYFLMAKGKGTEGKTRLVDFFNNVREIDSFLKEKKVDPVIADKVVALAKDGLTDSERKQILDLVGPVFGTAAAPAAQPAAASADKAADKALPAIALAPDAAAQPAAPTQPENPVLAQFEKLLKGKVPDGRDIGYGKEESQLEIEYRTYLLHSEVPLTGDYITDARVQPNGDTGQPEVSLTFDRTGAKKFEKLTGAHVRERMAIVLEGEVNSAPVIQDRIAGGSARITLGSAQDYNKVLSEANDLAVVLRAGAMPAPIRILEERTVGPSMGKDARTMGNWAMGIGFALVVFFMMLYYKVSGVIADIALLLNGLLVLVVMVLFDATLTLPGMAGIVLTLGMAVDANVIINERVREEVRAGKTPRAAIDAGYGRAFWTIFDANLTTLIAGVVLWSYGSGPVKGFAVTLTIGLVVSMFTAIFVTRVFMDFLTIHVKVEKLSV